MSTKKIVITGGPGTGKTSIINALKVKNYYCFDEVIRSLTLEAKQKVNEDAQISNPIAFVNDPLDFNTKLLEGRIAQFNDAESINESLIFFDRGIPDVLAYMNFFDQTYSSKFTNACKAHKYDSVFILPPWEAIYKSDNERFETFEEAQKIYMHLKQVYTRFGYQFTEVPFGNISERTHFILNSLII